MRDEIEKVLITGGAGFIGSHVAEYYAQKGKDVIIVDNLSRSKLLKRRKAITDLHNLNRLKKYKNIKFIEGDVKDVRTITNAGKGVDTIIHTAAQVAVTTSLTDPRTDFETNAIGTFNVLEVARENNSKVIFTSTNKVYGDNVNIIPIKLGATRWKFDRAYYNGINEKFLIDHTHHSPYGASKLAADLYVQEYAQQYGLKTAVFRMSCIYGTNQFGVEDQGWVAWFTIATLLQKPIIIYGDGNQVRDVLFIDDLVSLMDKFLKSNIKQGVFNVGGGKDNTLSLEELLTLLSEITKKEPKLSYTDWRPADQKVYISDITKATKALNWKPKISPEEGVKRLAQWCKTYFSVE